MKCLLFELFFFSRMGSCDPYPPNIGGKPYDFGVWHGNIVAGVQPITSTPKSTMLGSISSIICKSSSMPTVTLIFDKLKLLSLFVFLLCDALSLVSIWQQCCASLWSFIGYIFYYCLARITFLSPVHIWTIGTHTPPTDTHITKYSYSKSPHKHIYQSSLVTMFGKFYELPRIRFLVLPQFTCSWETISIHFSQIPPKPIQEHHTIQLSCLVLLRANDFIVL